MVCGCWLVVLWRSLVNLFTLVIQNVTLLLTFVISFPAGTFVPQLSAGIDIFHLTEVDDPDPTFTVRRGPGRPATKSKRGKKS